MKGRKGRTWTVRRIKPSPRPPQRPQRLKFDAEQAGDPTWDSIFRLFTPRAAIPKPATPRAGVIATPPGRYSRRTADDSSDTFSTPAPISVQLSLRTETSPPASIDEWAESEAGPITSEEAERVIKSTTDWNVTCSNIPRSAAHDHIELHRGSLASLPPISNRISSDSIARLSQQQPPIPITLPAPAADTLDRASRRATRYRTTKNSPQPRPEFPGQYGWMASPRSRQTPGSRVPHCAATAAEEMVAAAKARAEGGSATRRSAALAARVRQLETHIASSMGSHSFTSSYMESAMSSDEGPGSWADPVPPYATCVHSSPNGSAQPTLGEPMARWLRFSDRTPLQLASERRLRIVTHSPPDCLLTRTPATAVGLATERPSHSLPSSLQRPACALPHVHSNDFKPNQPCVPYFALFPFMRR
jgi:hypothetical protein